MSRQKWLHSRKKEHSKNKLTLPTTIISLFHEYSIINELRQFSKDKIQNTKMIPKQLRDKGLINGQNKRQEDTQAKSADIILRSDTKTKWPEY